MQDNYKFGSFILNGILGIVILFLIWFWPRHPAFSCDDCKGTVTITHDTIWPSEELKQVVVKVPEAFKAIAKKDLKQTHPKGAKDFQGVEGVDSVRFVSGASTAPIEGLVFLPSPCDSIFYVSDTTRVRQPDSCTIVVNDTLMDNHIIGRSIWHVNLQPTINTTITKVLKEKWKVFVGAQFSYNVRNQDRWGVGPSALLTIPKVGAISYYYDARNNAHTAGFDVLIRFKR